MDFEKIELNKEFSEALRLMEDGPEVLFVTGRAGTGKSTLLEYFKRKTKKRAVFLAATGVAAVNIKGQTLHSFFGFKPDITVEKVKKKYKNRGKRGFYRKLDLIVIDEISMIRADLLDCVDAFLRMHGKDKNKPFGGVRMVFIGDLYQLPPVVTGEERRIFKEFYKSPYFFDALVMKECKLKLVELKKIYRQKDEQFIRLLNKVRNRSVDDDDLEMINKRYEPEFEVSDEEMFVYLTTTNKMADEENERRLKQLRGKLYEFEGEMWGEFEKRSLPVKMSLKIKAGAQVMLCNNDRDGRWINGSIGRVMKVKDEEIIVELLDGEVVEVKQNTWECFRFYFDEKVGRVKSEAVGSFRQFPMILAWAVTIHKSQGKTFDRVIVDIGRGTFSHGQSYVALSRCTSFEGLVLKKPFLKKHILMDWRVVRFLTEFQYRLAEKRMSVEAKIGLIERVIEERGKLKIVYLKANDERSKRVIEPDEVGEMEYAGKEYLGVSGYCLKRQDERVFRVDRILELEVIENI